MCRARSCAGAVLGTASATSLAGWVNAVLLAVTLWRRELFRPSAVTLRRLAMIAQLRESP